MLIETQDIEKPIRKHFEVLFTDSQPSAIDEPKYIGHLTVTND